MTMAASGFGTIDLLSKEIANMGNEQARRCRIGKVSMKRPAPILYPSFKPLTSEELLKQLYPAWEWRPATTTGGVRWVRC